MKVLFQRQRDVPDVVCLGTGNLHECEQIYQRIEIVVGLPYLKAIVGEKGNVVKIAIYLGESGYKEFKPTKLKASVLPALEQLRQKLISMVSPQVIGFMSDGCNYAIRMPTADYHNLKLPNELSLEISQTVSKLQASTGMRFGSTYGIEYTKNGSVAPAWLSTDFLYCTEVIPRILEPTSLVH